MSDSLRDLIRQRRRWHIGLLECMGKYHSLLGNVHFGATGLFSYTYYLIYELLSPIIEIFGLLTIGIAFAANFINVPFMILFFALHAVFGAIMSLTAFFSRIQTRDLRISPSDAVRAVLLSIIEVTVLRTIMMATRNVAMFAYRRYARH